MTWSRDPDRYRGVGPTTAARIRERDAHACQICGAPGNEVDHITNRAAGGTDDDRNLRVLCTEHHRAKTQAEAAEGHARRRARGRLPVEPHPGLIARQRNGA
ncbi:HNH endonuclease [Nocardia sp. NPDC058480]|uniref:HNH endonuclease n=1 Tax=Nocardia sp. NPDC058480 TaxID=3346522 RepID=UPI00365AC77F